MSISPDLGKSMPYFRPAYMVLSILALTPHFYANAHEPDETIEVEGRKVNLVGDATSASQGIIGQAEINSRPLLRTGELLETIPGMVVTQHSGTGKANQYFLRGFNLDHGTDFHSKVVACPLICAAMATAKVIPT